jgi:DNA-binding transcriptional LysR family regulator
MELRHLRYFVAVAEAENFTKAAARLHLAQPALSRQVLALEEEIGVDLLKRTPRGVMLTAEGKLFLDRVYGILRQTDEAVAEVRALTRGEAGELHIGYGPLPTIELLPPAMAAFRKAAPQVKVTLHDMGGEEMIVGLREGVLELAVGPHPGLEEQGIAFECLKRYPYRVVCAPEHPLAKKKSATLQEAQAAGLIVYQRKGFADYHSRIRKLLAVKTIAPYIVQECDGGPSLLTAVDMGLGVAILHDVARLTASPRLKFVPIKPEPQPIEIGILHAQDGDLTPAGAKLIQILRRVAKQSSDELSS